MKSITLLAAVDREWGIGYHNQLLFHLKKDMEIFQQKTLQNIVVMGRKTLESLPGGRPLPNRKNIVLTRQTSLSRGDGEESGSLVVLHSRREVIQYVADAPEAVFIIGGGEVYQPFLDIASDAYITKVNEVKKADVYFPDLDRMAGWRLAFESEKMWDESGISYRFAYYRQCADLRK